MSQKSKNQVYTIKEINLGQCTFLKPVRENNIFKSTLVFNGTKSFVIQTPKLFLKDASANRFELLISKNKDSNRSFYDILSHLEDSAILNITQNSEEWFGKKMDRDQIDDMFRSCIHCPLEIDSPFLFRSNKAIGITAKPNQTIKCLIKIDGILFGRTNACLDMKIIQTKIVNDDPHPEDVEIDIDNEEQPIDKSDKSFHDLASVSGSVYTSRTNKTRGQNLLRNETQGNTMHLHEKSSLEIPVEKPVNETHKEYADLELNKDQLEQLKQLENSYIKQEEVIVHSAPINNTIQNQENSPKDISENNIIIERCEEKIPENDVQISNNSLEKVETQENLNNYSELTNSQKSNEFPSEQSSQKSNEFPSEQSSQKSSTFPSEQNSLATLSHKSSALSEQSSHNKELIRACVNNDYKRIKELKSMVAY
jgi:hypothetical protein